MSRLAITYDTLASTRNEAAIGVLLSVLRDSRDADTRLYALRALMERSETRAADELFGLWKTLSDREIKVLAQKPDWMESAVLGELHQMSDSTQQAIEAACKLRLYSAVPLLVTLAESCADRVVREAATLAVIFLVTPLGRDARNDRDHQSIRRPVVKRLADSVAYFMSHRNSSLLDAFLAASTWSDAGLRQTLASDSPLGDLLTVRMGSTNNESVMELLAGFIGRRRPSPGILNQIQLRPGVEFCDALLRVIGNEPTTGIVRNLQMLGIPVSCENGLKLVRAIDAQRRAALVHLYTSAGDDPQEILSIAIEALKLGGPKVESAVAICFAKCELLDVEFWMRAAIPVAEEDEEQIAKDDAAMLLRSLIDLLDHPEAAIVRGVQRVLGSLHADSMLPRMSKLRTRSRLRLGRVVMMIDQGAIDRVRDALRHPVLNKRLEAIGMAEALGLVDQLTDSFTRISRDDHQEARIQAAQAMAGATSDETMKLLQEMLDLPPSPVRDVATKAIAKRKEAVHS